MFLFVLQVMVRRGFQRILIDELESAALQTKRSWNLLTSIWEITMILAVTSYQLPVISYQILDATTKEHACLKI
jgi:hypothetical protein